MIRGIEKSPIFEDDQDRKGFISSGKMGTTPIFCLSMSNTSIAGKITIMKKLLEYGTINDLMPGKGQV